MRPLFSARSYPTSNPLSLSCDQVGPSSRPADSPGCFLHHEARHLGYRRCCSGSAGSTQLDQLRLLARPPAKRGLVELKKSAHTDCRRMILNGACPGMSALFGLRLRQGAQERLAERLCRPLPNEFVNMRWSI